MEKSIQKISKTSVFTMFLFSFWLFSFFFFFSFPSMGKNLHQRLGVGYMRSAFEELSTLTARYYPSSKWGVAGSLGLDTKKKDGRFSFSAKFYYLVFTEENMNFYMGSEAGLLSRSVEVEEEEEEANSEEETLRKSALGFSLSAFIGGEFFLPGLKNLGFSFESGFQVTSANDEIRFNTIGFSPIRAGIIFYF